MESKQDFFDVIVVGAGHAGCEAALSAARLGSRVLLITMNMQTIGQMSCNPAMGGVAKGQIVREIDALGGGSAVVTDKSSIQFRMLNASKGPAMWSPRSQNDRMKFAEEWRFLLENTPRVFFRQDVVKDLLIEKDVVIGVLTSLGNKIKAKTVILTNGTFLNGLIHVGDKSFSGGRAGEKSVEGLTETLIDRGFVTGRMKTGTPPRVDRRSLDLSKMQEQWGDEERGCFSYEEVEGLSEQRCCWITYTNTSVHDIINEGIERSPLFSGKIKGVGPRYCPSVEDKVFRFAEKERHQIFVEPEGLRTVEIYVNGFSTSLPEDIQEKALRQVVGFEKAAIFRPGYAIEYDYFIPTQLKPSLETKILKNLFFAGQINGTTGYEEAAAQGFVAGVNAHCNVEEKDPFVLSRSDAYIGVLIDDLVTKGTDEPYRMFTSRAEHRLLLRQDNADIRLTEKAFRLGLVGEEKINRVWEKQRKSQDLQKKIAGISMKAEDINVFLEEHASSPVSQKIKIDALVLRPQIRLQDLLSFLEEKAGIDLDGFDKEVVLLTEIQMKYKTYLEKERETVEKMKSFEHKKINPDCEYSGLVSMSLEAREKLQKIKPTTLGQASRISGVSPADIAVLMLNLGK